MPSLLGSSKLGNSSSSSLLKSANSIAVQVANYQDSVEAYNYGLSAYTDAAYNDYTTYLNSRITSLSAVPSLTNEQKVLTLTKTMDSATKSNVSASITRENIQIMSGSATPTDKYNLISNQYVRAVGNGDLTLAQSLESQAYSLSQTIQYQAQQAADASQTLAKATATAGAAGYEDIVTNLKFSLSQLNNDIKSGGQSKFNSTIKQWVTQNSDTLKALGVALPDGAAPNYFDIVNGVAGAIYNNHMLAAAALQTTDPLRAQDYRDKAQAAATTDKFGTLAGGKTALEIQQAASNPQQFVYDQTTGGLVETKQSGNILAPDSSGKLTVQPTYSGTVQQTTFLSPGQTAVMSKLGLNFSANSNGTTGNGVKVQATNDTPDWLKTVLGNNNVANVFTNNQGQLQFTADATSGEGKAIYTVVTDSRGKVALGEDSATSSTILGGEYGYNTNPPGVSTSGGGYFGWASLTHAIGSIGHQIADLFLGHASAQGLINQAQVTQSGIAVANAAAQAKLMLAAPPSLPALSVSNTPPPPVTIAPKVTAPTTTSVLQPTANPQQTSTAPLQSGGVNLQGGNINLQGGSLRLQ